MITCGLDIGAGSVKGVLLEDGKTIIAKDMDKTGGKPLESSERLFKKILEQNGLKRSDISYLTTTGFGRYLFPDRDLQLSDITTNASGAKFLFPKTSTVVDIGTQSTRAISIDEKGKVMKFKFTEKCAAGAGRFIERCSKYLQIPIPELGPLAMKAKEPLTISSVCAVLAETEIINFVTLEKEVSDIVMGVLLSIATRATTLLRRVGLKPELTLTGGLVYNQGMVKALETKTGMTLNVSPLGHYASAIGAARLGFRRLQSLEANALL